MRCQLLLHSLVCLACAARLAAAAPPSPKRVELAGFLADLTAISEQLTHDQQADASTVLGLVPPAWSVTIHDVAYDVDAEWIAAALSSNQRSWADRRSMILDRLQVLRDEAHALAADVPSNARVGARTTLGEILATREFRDRNVTGNTSSLWALILDWLHSLPLRLGLGSVAATTIASAMAWVAAGGALIGVGAWVYVRGRDRRQSAPPPPASAAASRSSSDWLKRAVAASHANNSREAVRCAYHAVVFRFGEQGAWRLDAARTPREYVRLLEPEDPLRPPFAALARDFESAWYGSRSVELGSLVERLKVLGCAVPHE